MKTFIAILTDPDGRSEEYDVTAANKTQARKKVSDLYYRDVPRQAKSAGFYSFSDHRLTWKESEA